MDHRIYYHEDIDRWTVGPSPIPHGYLEKKEYAEAALIGVMKGEEREKKEAYRNRAKLTSERESHRSGVPGVTWNIKYHKWQAYIYYHGQPRFLGWFDDMKKAITCRRQAEARKRRTLACSARSKEKAAIKAAEDKALTKAAKHEETIKRSHLYRDILRERKKY